MEWYLKVVRDNYVNFEGRARRKEYWMFVLVNALIVIALSIVENVVGLNIGEDTGILSGIYALGVLLPTVAVAIRRLHDTDRSGWWLLIAFVPLIGALVLLYFYVVDGTQGPNKYGPSPKGISVPLPDATEPESTPTPENPPQKPGTES